MEDMSFDPKSSGHGDAGGKPFVLAAGAAVLVATLVIAFWYLGASDEARPEPAGPPVNLPLLSQRSKIS